MNSYEVIITPDAEADLFEIRDYIAYTLLVPDVSMLCRTFHMIFFIAECKIHNFILEKIFLEIEKIILKDW